MKMKLKASKLEVKPSLFTDDSCYIPKLLENLFERPLIQEVNGTRFQDTILIHKTQLCILSMNNPEKKLRQ
jgi:hypothetical protein